jgi:3-oxoacyl-[acyl-carrier protein] reductase
MAREVLPHMQRQGGGRIVNVVGAAARNPAVTYMMGGTANAALINFTKALSDLAVKSQVLVTGVSPGPVKTERWDSLMAQQAKAAGQDTENYVRERSQEFPLGRIALPEEIADVVCFLASARLVSHRDYRHRGRWPHPRGISLSKFCCADGTPSKGIT